MSNETPQNDPLEFMKGMWGNMGFSLPGMVAPTFDVDELEKRIHDLKAVEGWLRMNLSMLQMTIQGLEMQCSTLNAVRAMGQHMATETPQTRNEEPSAPNEPAEQEPFAQAAMWPWNMMQQVQAQMQQQVQESARNEDTAEPKPKKTTPSARKPKK
ncbi:MAG: hypothetical protein H6943_05455 [Zoogloeaceae bacterium]|nr:hypothetical protein [Zoogloeaceae bacterium]